MYMNKSFPAKSPILTGVFFSVYFTGMCTRPSEPTPRRDPRPMSLRSRRDWDVQNFVRNKIETRRCSFRDAGRELEAPETLESLGSFNVSPRRFLWHMVRHIDDEKIYGLLNLHHGKRFLLFVILWVFALYLDNHHWIINGLHHKTLQNCNAVHMSHYVYCNLQATEISKLQLIIALYVIYIWLIVFILTSYTLSSLLLQRAAEKVAP